MEIHLTGIPAAAVFVLVPMIFVIGLITVVFGAFSIIADIRTWWRR